MMPLAVSPAEFFESALQAYRAAQGKSPFQRRFHYRFGATGVTLETPSPKLAEVFARALGEGVQDFLPGSQIWAWDEHSTGVTCPPPPWGHHSPYTRRGDVPVFQDPRYRCAYNCASFVLCLYDRQERLGVYWTRDARALPGWEQTAPMRTLLHWHGLEEGMQMTHGAVVDGLLLAGKGGSGKSTTALACLEAGMPFLGDDYSFVQLEPQPKACGIFVNARIFANSLPWLPVLSRVEGQPSDDKIAINIDSRRQPEMALKALILPRLAPGPSLEPATFEEALKAVALPTMAQLPGAGPETYTLLSKLCQSLPSYRLNLNRPAPEIAALLKEMVV